MANQIIVLNEKGKRERPVPKPKPQPFVDIYQYLAVKCNDQEYEEIIAALKAAEEHTQVRWNSYNLDRALTWDDSPQGHGYWSEWHFELQKR